ncbi:MAG: acyl-CoA/acyl-ACP dehydrogenase [Solirubrobacterales bacterium]|nr:acyl-CoA/acyl-ACP dehydrogenase [Solirubrobacterales bacterium]
MTFRVEERQGLTEAAWEIGANVSAPAADDVDANARFPEETRAALAQAKILSALIPAELGGGGASLSDVSGAIRALAFHCASSALMLAMHSNEVGQLVQFGDTPGLRALAGEVAEKQLLIANANSEVGLGGDATRSNCAVEEIEGVPSLNKHALACSYGQHADLLSATARRRPDAEPNDQLVALMRRESLVIEEAGEWNTMGLRGTCSAPLRFSAKIDPALVYPVDFAYMGEHGMMARWLIMLSSVWVGLAEAAVDQAHRHVRKAARRSVGTLPPSATRLAELQSKLLQSRGALAVALDAYARAAAEDHLDDTALLVTVRGLKVATSKLLVDIASEAMSIVGIMGFQRGSGSLERIVRDAHGSVLMVSNDRYLQANAVALTVLKRI